MGTGLTLGWPGHDHLAAGKNDREEHGGGGGRKHSVLAEAACWGCG